MDIKDFKDKVVIDKKTGSRYRIHEITSPSISVVAENPDENGHFKRYIYNTTNGDPISNGSLGFEDEALTDAFIKVYDAYCKSRAAYWEEYGYWMRKD